MSERALEILRRELLRARKSSDALAAQKRFEASRIDEVLAMNLAAIISEIESSDSHTNEASQ